MKEWIKDIVVAIIIAVIIMQFIKPTIVKETSMQPTLYENNYIFLSKQSYRFHEPEAGDIIVFHTNLKTDAGKEKLLIKRVIGTPGDIITIREGKVYINEKPMDEPYTLEPYTSGQVDNLEIPEGSLFVMGDNRQNSADSRDPSVGLVKTEKIVGKAVFRLFPFNKIGFLE